MASMRYKVGIMGDGVMGTHLARNIASKGTSVLVYGHHQEKIDTMMQAESLPSLEGTLNFETFLEQLVSPRVVMLTLPAGKALERACEQLEEHLDEGDTIIDFGNSHYKRTEERQAQCAKKGIVFIGAGLSGGPEGARYGASIMPSGEKKALSKIMPILEQLAAKDFHEKPCVTAIGQGGSGHFVKMVHNGIEYAFMQLIADIYEQLRDLYDISAKDSAMYFERWNDGNLRSFLLETTTKVLRKRSENKDQSLIDLIRDQASQKGTGIWLTEEALALGRSANMISESVFARIESEQKELRERLSKQYASCRSNNALPLEDFLRAAEQTLLSGLIIAFCQGLELIKEASDKNQWNVNISEVLRIWQGGCIIRCNILDKLYRIYKEEPLTTLLENQHIVVLLQRNICGLRTLASQAITTGHGAPAVLAAVHYFDMMTDQMTAANLIQGIRDAFGAHGYERTDKPGLFHSDWNS